MTELHVIVPAGIDDPGRPSGGNTYDRHVIEGLRGLGWDVHVHEVGGAWPRPRGTDLDRLAAVVADVPTGRLVLVDGLVASCSPSVLVPEAARVSLVVLVHMPLGPTAREAVSGERRVLSAAAAVVAPSRWTRDLLVEAYGLVADSVHVAAPGVDAAPLAVGSPSGGQLLCVAAVTPHKGHLDLADALVRVADLPWVCTCVGALAVDPGHVARVRARLSGHGLEGRVELIGPLTGAALDEAYDGADLLVLPSRTETYGMVVSEALARGIPVLAAAVGGVPEALGSPEAGVLVPPARPDRLAEALRTWLGDPRLQARLRGAAADRRGTLAGWSDTATTVSHVLERVLVR